MVFQSGVLVPVHPETQLSVDNFSTLTSRKAKILEDRSVFLPAHDSSRSAGWIDKLQQAGFCMQELSASKESIKSFRGSLKAPTKEVILQLCRLNPKTGMQLMTKMQELCTVLETTEKPIVPRSGELTVQMMLNDIHAVVMQLDESLLEPAPDADPILQETCSEWLKQVQAYVLWLQRELGGLTDDIEADSRDSWAHLMHGIRTSFQNVLTEVKSSGVQVSHWTVLSPRSGSTTTRRRSRKVVHHSCMPYAYWAKRVAI